MNNQDLKTRKIAWKIIKKALTSNRRLSDVIFETFRSDEAKLTYQEKRFVTMLVQGTVRLQGRLNWEIKQVFHGDFNNLKENLKILLRIGVYQIFYMDSVPDYAAVTTTVQLAKRIHKSLGGLSNAILRTIIKEKHDFIINENSPIADLSEYLSHPQWLIKKWIKDYSFKDAQLIAEWNNKKPNIWFRINTSKIDIDNFKEILYNEGFETEHFEHMEEFFTTNKNQDLLHSDYFKNGNISVQDPSAGLVVKLLNPKSYQSIVDICAAPGGKSTYISELTNGLSKIEAYDKDKKRLIKLKENIKRLNLENINAMCLDITTTKINKTDKMLLDAPCSGTGVMSKKADLRWRRSQDEILEMHLLQRKILWSAANFIKPNGLIVYSTCSIEIDENNMVIDAFLKAHPQFNIESAVDFIPEKYIDERGCMNIFSPKHKIDGGFAVRLRKDA